MINNLRCYTSKVKEFNLTFFCFLVILKPPLHDYCGFLLAEELSKYFHDAATAAQTFGNTKGIFRDLDTSIHPAFWVETHFVPQKNFTPNLSYFAVYYLKMA